ncbi:hypothetical protein H312_01225, partial [Anncaliia algerae PRA339]
MRLNINHPCFLSLENLREYLLDNEIIFESKPCRICGYIALLVININNGKHKLLYRCKNQLCRYRQSLLNTKIPLNKYLQLVYCLILNMNYYQIKNCVAVQDEAISNARKKLRELMSAYMARQTILLGGLNCIVECDETVLCRRGTIRQPTSLDDNYPDTT